MIMSLHTPKFSLHHKGQHRPALPSSHCPPTLSDDGPLSLLRHQHHRHLSPPHSWIDQFHRPRTSTLQSRYHLNSMLQARRVIETAVLATLTPHRDHHPAVSHLTRQTRVRTTG